MLLLSLTFAFGLLQSVTSQTWNGDKNFNKTIDVHNELFRPWMARLKRKYVYGTSDPFCSAFLIKRPVNNESSDLLLTSSTCFPVLNGNIQPHPGSFIVTLGRYAEIEREVKVILQHPLYKFANQSANPAYDVAIIKLWEPVDFSENVEPLLLSTYKLSSVSSCVSYKQRLFPSIKQNNSNIFYITETVLYDNPEIHNGYTRQSTYRGTHEITHGTPLICMINNVSVAQGIYHGRVTNWTTVYDTFTTIPRRSMWLKKNLHLIDFYQLDFYHEDLYRYETEKKTGATVNFIEKLRNDVEISRGFSQPLFDKALTTNVSVIRTELLKLWTEKRIYNHFNAYSDRFAVSNILGYVSADDAYHCVIVCFLHQISQCSYYLFYKRCYLMDSVDYGLDLHFAGSISLALATNSEQKEMEEVTFENLIPLSKVPRMNYTDHTWKVSLRSQLWSDYHCICELVSSNGSFYDHIEMSSACNELLRNSSSHSSGTETLIIRMHDIPGVEKGYQIQIEFDLNSTSNQLRLPNPKQRPPQQPTKVGNKKNDPSLIIYNPEMGSFISQPHSTPWLLLVRDMNMICTGVLLDKRHILVSKNEWTFGEKYVLVAITRRVGKHSGSTIMVEEKYYSPDDAKFQLLIVEAIEDIELNDFVQPIALPLTDQLENTSQLIGISLSKDAHANAGKWVTHDIPITRRNVQNDGYLFDAIHSRPYENSAVPGKSNDLVVSYNAARNEYTLYSLDYDQSTGRLTPITQEAVQWIKGHMLKD